MDVTIKCSDDGNNNKKSAHPHENASILAKIFFCWTLPLFRKGFKKDLSDDDLFSTLGHHDSAFLTKKLEDSWNYEIESYEKPSLLRALWRVFGREFLVFGASVFCLEFIVRLSQPLLIWRLMIFHTPHQETISCEEAFICALFIILSAFLNVLIYHSTSLHLFFLGTKIKIASCSLIYRKSLKLAQCDSSQSGKVLNLISNDLTRLDKLLQQLHYLWCAPLEAVIVAYLLYIILGPTAVAGYIVFLVFIPVQTLIGKLWAVLRLKTAKKTDERIRLLNEIISGIRIIKMHAWERLFIGQMDDARKSEIGYVRKVTYLRAIQTSFTKFVTKSAVFISLLAFVLTGNHIHARYVFVTKSFYNFLKESMTNNFPHGIKSIGELLATFKRIQQVLLCEETPRKVTDRKRKVVGISLENVYAKWGQVNILKNVTFTAGPKQSVAVVGSVGSGKTSLINAILGELPVIGIEKEVTGKLSYAAQEPWIFAGTIRQNILFGLPMNGKRYKEIICACALEQDFDGLPLGDCSVVGEKGVTLSGGQKARISLARAVYRDVDIYLLDDPLSAVDAVVGKQLFENCILKFLRNKCVVLVTHHLQYLKHINLIYLFDNGKVVASGSYEEIQKSSNDYVELLKDSTDTVQNFEDVTNLAKWETSYHEPSQDKETKSVGTIPLNIYWDYFRSGGSTFSLFGVALSLVLVQCVASYADYFEAFWVNMERNGSSEKNNVYIYTYLIIALILLIIFSSICFYTYFTFVSINLHNKMFSNILKTAMKFFHLNPSGRILNRFCKDVGAVDEVIPQILMDTLHMGLSVAAVTVILALVNPWITLVTVTLLVLFYLARIVYLATIRDVKRIEAVSRSPLVTHLNVSLQGVTTIRAFGVEKMLSNKFDVHQNAHTSANYTFLSCRTTFGFWLDFCCAVYISIVTVSCFLLEGETSGNIGLMITQAISLSGMFQFGMKQWSELETQMTSVERIAEYTSIKPEADRFQASKKSWPITNDVVFQNVSVRYDDCVALDNVTFRIAAKEKIGIIGRTGAGKSSIISAIFRLVDFDGQIIISGTPISQLPLKLVRSKIAIIPQEPVLFSGTLRSNLDPFGHFDDSSLWQVLEEIELKEFVTKLPLGLDCKISGSGSNLSVGQRQLFCLARALLLEKKILVLDEATANVDLKTDSLIQETIKKKFANCTVLVIAHRLQTVMDCDRILVMDSGKVAEFGHPHELLQNTNGALHGFLAKSGSSVADNFRVIAEEVRFGNDAPRSQGVH